MKYICTICGYIYDEAKEKALFKDLPDTWQCPLCGAKKSDFKLMDDPDCEIKTKAVTPSTVSKIKNAAANETVYQAENKIEKEADLTKLSQGQLAAICTNLARGCEKQYMPEAAAEYRKLGDYFTKQVSPVSDATVDKMLSMLERSITEDYPHANEVCGVEPDRGALRALTWGEKVTRILNSLMKRYNSGEMMFSEKDEVWVCSICGFVYISENPPELCPVCKVPSSKFEKVEGRNKS